MMMELENHQLATIIIITDPDVNHEWMLKQVESLMRTRNFT